MNDIDRLEERIATLEKVFLKENERLESKIKALENELDEMFKMLEQTMQVKKAVLEIEEHLQKKQNGFDAHYFPILTYFRK
jgi:septation ring formation regulator EzrA